MAPLGSLAQRPGKIWRIGMLETTSTALNAAHIDAFRMGMKDLGYVEGRNYTIEYRSADGSNDRFPDFATEMVRGKVDLIVKGAKPADLPVEQVSRFELLVNQKTARELGIKIPSSILLRADRVIE